MIDTDEVGIRVGSGGGQRIIIDGEADRNHDVEAFGHAGVYRAGEVAGRLRLDGDGVQIKIFFGTLHALVGELIEGPVVDATAARHQAYALDAILGADQRHTAQAHHGDQQKGEQKFEVHV